jgi:poly-gamma-glutamate capsule biosynthesis protein CapA/YwtB (metallophosphatase superfamily)
MFRTLGTLAIVLLGPCDRATRAPAERASVVRTLQAPTPQPSSLATPSSATSPATQVEIVLAGDIIPQALVLRSSLSEVFSQMPPFWFAADARIANFEGTVGPSHLVPKDPGTLAFAAPPGWLGKLRDAGKFTALVTANNHGCDLGTEGAAALQRDAKRSDIPIVGLATTRALTPVLLAEKNGKRVCGVAWSTFFNDEKRFADRCRLGRSTPQFGRVPASREGAQMLASMFGDRQALAHCDATIAYIHGGPEYRKQSGAILDHVRTASKYFDAIVVSHPHVPDEVVTFQTSEGRAIPVFLSVGNFVSNQGVGWSSGMKVESLPNDPIRNAWTRVGLIARLQFSWPAGAARPSLHYGYTPLFVAREGSRSAPIPTVLSPHQSGTRDLYAAFANTKDTPFAPATLLGAQCMFLSDAYPCEAASYSVSAAAAAAHSSGPVLSSGAASGSGPGANR